MKIVRDVIIQKNNICIKCNTKNCNLTPFLRHLIKCIKCKDDDVKCSLGFDKHDAKDCHETPYYTNETCFIHINDSKINRGCTLDNENTKFNCIDNKNDLCKICNEDSCNTEKIEHQKCIQCRSDAIPVCAENGVGNMEPKFCKDENHSDNLGCYTERYKNIVMRSCVSDLTSDEIETCKKKIKIALYVMVMVVIIKNHQIQPLEFVHFQFYFLY